MGVSAERPENLGKLRPSTKYTAVHGNGAPWRTPERSLILLAGPWIGAPSWAEPFNEPTIRDTVCGGVDGSIRADDLHRMGADDLGRRAVPSA